VKIVLDFIINDLCPEVTSSHAFPILYLNAVFHSTLFMQLLRSVLIIGFLTALIRKILPFVISSFIFVFIIF